MRYIVFLSIFSLLTVGCKPKSVVVNQDTMPEKNAVEVMEQTNKDTTLKGSIGEKSEYTTEKRIGGVVSGQFQVVNVKHSVQNGFERVEIEYDNVGNPLYMAEAASNDVALVNLQESNIAPSLGSSHRIVVSIADTQIASLPEAKKSQEINATIVKRIEYLDTEISESSAFVIATRGERRFKTYNVENPPRLVIDIL